MWRSIELVRLAESEAVAIGEEDIAKDIHRLCARTRTLRGGDPAKLRKNYALATRIASVTFAIVLAIAIAGELFPGGGDDVQFYADHLVYGLNVNDLQVPLISVTIASSLVALGVRVLMMVYGPPLVVICPMTLAEYRQVQVNNWYPSLAYIVAVAGVVVAIIAIIVPLALK